MRRLSLLLSSSLALTQARVPLRRRHARARRPFAGGRALLRRRRSSARAQLYDGAATPACAAAGKFRKDYARRHQIDSLSLNFDIHEEETLVTSTLTIVTAGDALRGDATADGARWRGPRAAVDRAQRDAAERGFGLRADARRPLPPQAARRHQPFVLKTTVSIEPHKNTQLSGSTRARACLTQCEAEGFRRITYFQDRSDDVRIEADKAACSSNGNEVSKGDADGGRHWASFTDPFRKPSYLFACVAGDLGGIESTLRRARAARPPRALVGAENVDQLD